MVKFTDIEGKSPKIKQIEVVAKELFWKFGIKKVSIEEICQKAGVSKVTFYKFFENKIDLAIYILDQVYKESIELYRELMARDIPFEEKVKESVRLKLEGTKDLSNELVEDILAHPDPKLKAYYAEIAGAVIQEVIKGYSDAQKKGEIRSDIKIEFMMFFMGHMMELAHDERLLGLYGNSRDAIIELLNFFFYGIMPRNNA